MLELIVYQREELGKKVKVLRRRQILPAVIYGWGIEARPVKVSYADFEKVYKEAGESSLVTLKVKEMEKSVAGEETVVLIHEPARDPLSDKFLHVDFYKVRLDEKIKINVPLIFVGESPAVRDAGGVLVKNFHEIEVEGYPHKLPKNLAVDIPKLQTFEDDVFVRDIQVPEGIEILADPDAVVASVIPPRSEAELASLEEAPEERVEEVEVVGKEEKEEEVEEVEKTEEK